LDPNRTFGSSPFACFALIIRSVNPFGGKLCGNNGKTAFVTGGASGIGFALCRAFAEVGMKVMLADIETDDMPRQPDDPLTAVQQTLPDLLLARPGLSLIGRAFEADGRR
jgi:short chain dehydrogenase